MERRSYGAHIHPTWIFESEEESDNEEEPGKGTLLFHEELQQTAATQLSAFVHLHIWTEVHANCFGEGWGQCGLRHPHVLRHILLIHLFLRFLFINEDVMFLHSLIIFCWDRWSLFNRAKVKVVFHSGSQLKLNLLTVFEWVQPFHNAAVFPTCFTKWHCYATSSAACFLASQTCPYLASTLDMMTSTWWCAAIVTR